MKYTLQWTDANHRCFHLRKAVGRKVLLRHLEWLTAKKKNGSHAVLLTLCLTEEPRAPLPAAADPVQVRLSCADAQKGGL